MNCVDYQAGRCRSCSELEVPYAEQLQRKQRHAQTALAAYAPNWLPPVPSAISGFRNKAKMAVGGTKQAPTLGILDPGGLGIDLESCMLYPDSLRACFAPLRDWLVQARVDPYQLTTRRGEAKYLLLSEAPGTGELLLRVVLRSREPLERLVKALPLLCARLPKLRSVSANLLPEHKAVTEGEIELPLWGAAAIKAVVNGIPLYLRPRSFFQTNSMVAAQLYQQGQSWLEETQAASVWDLYCGVGGFALHLSAAGRRCIGVESSSEAITAATESAAELGLHDTAFVAADALTWARAQTKSPEVIVVNPPRRGIGAELADLLNASGAKSILYSSCLMDSLARDLSRLDRYQVTRAQVYDMFAHTLHYETLVQLQRRD